MIEINYNNNPVAVGLKSFLFWLEEEVLIIDGIEVGELKKNDRFGALKNIPVECTYWIDAGMLGIKCWIEIKDKKQEVILKVKKREDLRLLQKRIEELFPYPLCFFLVKKNDRVRGF